MTTDDDDLDDASLKSMRAVWLSMRDEEPPAAGMSALLAAAAEKAEQMRDETQPWWQRALVFLRRPPALAFATVMILIGGAVLVTRTSSDKKTESEVAAPTQAVEESRQPGSGAIAAPNAPAADPADEREKQEVKDTPPPPPPPPLVEKPPVRPKNSKPKAKEDPRPEPNRYDRFEDEPTKTNAESGADRSDLDGTKLETPARIRDDKGGAAKQVTETIEVTGGTSPAPKAPESSAGEREQQTATIEQLAQQAESAAARGDCAAVKAIVARIKQRNEGFYKTRLGKSAAVTKCL